MLHAATEGTECLPIRDHSHLGQIATADEEDGPAVSRSASRRHDSQMTQGAFARPREPLQSDAVPKNVLVMFDQARILENSSSP